MKRFLLWLVYPVPRHTVHLSRMIFPVPPQSGQVVTFLTEPNMVCCVYVI